MQQSFLSFAGLSLTWTRRRVVFWKTVILRHFRIPRVVRWTCHITLREIVRFIRLYATQTARN